MGDIARVARGLAAQSTSIYVLGVATIAAVRYRPGPLVGLPADVEAVAIPGVLVVMTVTYLAELAVGADTFDGHRPITTVPTLLVASGLVGTAVAGFFLATNRPLVGFPFLFGGILLARAGVHRLPEEDSSATTTGRRPGRDE